MHPLDSDFVVVSLRLNSGAIKRRRLSRIEPGKRCPATIVIYYLPIKRSLTVRLLRPLRRRRDSTLRPSLSAIRERNPCLLRRFRRLGWYVRFITENLVESDQKVLDYEESNTSKW